MAACDVCGAVDGLHYTCNECGRRHCAQHMLPENHNCRALASKVRFGASTKDSRWNKRSAIKLLVGVLIIFSVGSVVTVAGSSPGVFNIGWDDTGEHQVPGNDTGSVSDADTAEEKSEEATTAQKTSEAPKNEATINPHEVERLIFERVNRIRFDNGKDTLDKNGYAAKYAREHAVDMAKNDYFSHTSLDGQTQQQRYSFCEGGENAAQTWINQQVMTDDGVEIYTTKQELAEGIVNQWMNSRPHRVRGILGDSWVAGGVGVAIGDSKKVYAVFGFCSTYG